MQIRLPVFAVFFSLVLAGCPGPTPDGVKVNERVSVLGEDSRERLLGFALDPVAGSGELQFEAGDPALAKIDVGRVLVSEPVEGIAPFGFLQRVESRRTEGDTLVFTTRQATLEETFDEADITHEVELRPSDLVSAQMSHPRIKLRRMDARQAAEGSKSYDFTVDFDKVLIDLDGDESTLDDQLKIDGAFKFSAGVTAKIRIGTEYVVVPTLEHLKFLATMKESVDLTITGALSKQFEKEVEVANFHFGAITVLVGPVPVVFSINLKLTVGAEGKIEAHLLATAAQSLEVSVGAEYKSGDGWKNLSDYKSSFDFPTPQVTAAGSAKAFAKPALGIKIYGVAGPFATSTAFVAVDAELDRDPFWNLRAGVDLGVGFKAELPVIGKLADWSSTFELFRKDLDSSPNTTPILEVLSPSDAAQIQEGEALDFVVRASDREQKTLTVTIKKGGQEVAAANVQRGESVTLSAGRQCPGTHQFEVSTKDAKGAVTRKNLSVVVKNRVPTVTLREDLLTGLTIVPGSLLVATASALDVTCEGTGNTANQNLIKWYVNGQLVGTPSATLLHVVPAATSVGTVLNVQARYDDGTDVGVSTTAAVTVSAGTPGANQAPVGLITAPVHGGEYNIAATWSLAAIAYDAEDGQLAGASIKWAFENATQTGWITLPQGQSNFRLLDLYPGQTNQSRRVRLTVTDSGGLSSTHIVTIVGKVEG